VGWLARPATQEEASLADTLARLALMDMLDRNAEDQTDDAVQLTTLHAAKGLEFPRVFLVGMEEELLPHRNSPDGAALEEERRLCYVGITRARRSLTITYADRRRRYGEDVSCLPSRFLQELPQQDLEFEGSGPPPTAEERLSRGHEYVSSLRELLTKH